jgi:hypothetical protein
MDECCPWKLPKNRKARHRYATSKIEDIPRNAPRKTANQSSFPNPLWEGDLKSHQKPFPKNFTHN